MELTVNVKDEKPSAMLADQMKVGQVGKVNYGMVHWVLKTYTNVISLTNMGQTTWSNGAPVLIEGPYNVEDIVINVRKV